MARFKKWLPVLFWVGLLGVLLVNSQTISYPDEFDNILGGKLILHGILPYSGFFSHHGILAYFLAAPLVLLGGISFVHFRFLTAFFYLGLFLLEAWLLTRRTGNLFKNYFLIFLGFLVVAATYFWGQLFLADTLAGYLLIMPYALLILKVYDDKKLETVDLVIISLFSAAAVLVSTTYLYAGLVIGLVTTVYYVRSFKTLVRLVVIFAAPYLVFLVYLIVTHSLGDFLFQAITYNQRYYIYNYPRPAGSAAFNPIRYAVVLFNDFFDSFFVSATGLLGFNPRYPLTHLFSLADIALWLWLGIKKKYPLLLFSLLAIVYVSARANPADIKASDYQTAVYFMLSLLNVFLALCFIKSGLNSNLDRLSTAVTTVVAVVLVIFTFFGGMFLSLVLWQNTYNRFMGASPNIYDRPVVAPIFNAVIPADHYCWVGPFEFEEMFYSNCKLPSKYHWILPQFGKIDQVKKEIITDYSARLPDIIVFRRDYSAFGLTTEFDNFFVDFLNQKYVVIKDVDPQRKYHFISPKEKDFNFDADFNFEKSQAPALVAKLVAEGYVTSGQ